MESWLPWLVDDGNGDRAMLITDVLPEAAKVVLIEPRRMRDRAADLIAEEDDLARTLASTWARDPDKTFPRLHAEPDVLLTAAGSFWSIDSTPESPDTPLVEAMGWGPVVGDGSGLTDRLRDLLADGYRVVVAADGDGSARRLKSLLLDQGLDFALVPGSPTNSRAAVRSSWRRCTVASRCRTRRWRSSPSPTSPVAAGPTVGARPRKRGETASTFEDLKTGSYVVHHQHGVGQYEGMVKRAIGGVERDYLLVAYKGGDKLYIPSDQIDAIRQYVGGEAPKLHKLGGSDFAKTKSRVKSEVRQVAQELVLLYQQRITAEGHQFAQDTPWQAEMEEAFPFVETPDQHKAIIDIKADMEREFPMDRLVCGDVGFGKTEIAIRAAFKAIQDGKQVAVLAPTTLLATQHGNTFADRFAGYPIRVEVLSRFLTAAQAKKVIADVKSGEVDCVIGTHRLLAADIHFKDLGLLVVDEEQRFGVQHKEKMKRMKTNVDVLTLSATPIPRTLEMSLVGIRDLSLLQTPPAERQPILTYVGEYDERVAVEAIRRELLREGQVFWVHNRVRSIETSAQRLRQLVPEARIAIAHGQLDEGTLEQVVQDFWDGEFDVLVCTTIIESGIDMPAVNTMVVERADLLGLGQMHQIRGRVGRSGQRAYAYLFHPQDKVLTEEAYERLRTIGESTELGSGFKIAMRDLEIRGAGIAARRIAVRPHRGGRLRPLLPDGDRGRQRDEGRAAAQPARRDQARRPDRLLPARRLRREGGAAARGLPPAGRRHDRRPGRRHPHRVGGPLRSRCPHRPSRCSRWATSVPNATGSASGTSRSRRAMPASSRSIFPSAPRSGSDASPRAPSTKRTSSNWSSRSPAARIPPPTSCSSCATSCRPSDVDAPGAPPAAPATDSVQRVNRRLMTILLPLAAAALTAGCTTFSDADAVARVGDTELSISRTRRVARRATDPRRSPQRSEPRPAGDLRLDRGRRRSRTGCSAPTSIGAIPDEQLLALYRDGIDVAGVTCVRLIVTSSAEAGDRTPQKQPPIGSEPATISPTCSTR